MGSIGPGEKIENWPTVSKVNEYVIIYYIVFAHKVNNNLEVVYKWTKTIRNLNKEK